jgi:hypothetical protein
MPGTVRCGFVAACCALLIAGGYAAAESLCAPDRTQHSGSMCRICIPPAAAYTGSLVLWAHGCQDARTPVHIPEAPDSIGLRGEVVIPSHDA